MAGRCDEVQVTAVRDLIDVHVERIERDKTLGIFIPAAVAIAEGCPHQEVTGRNQDHGRGVLAWSEIAAKSDGARQQANGDDDDKRVEPSHEPELPKLAGGVKALEVLGRRVVCVKHETPMRRSHHCSWLIAVLLAATPLLSAAADSV